MSDMLTGIASMATRALLINLSEACARAGGATVRFESAGGVDAARRVREGENFDLIVLAADAIDALAASGHVVPKSRCALVDSTVAIAIRAGLPAPDITSADALRRAVLAANRIGYSTGPSGTALMRLFARWGVAEALRDRLVQARPGVPVATLLARGDVEVGFQQLSELQGQDGIVVLGPMPPGLEILTTFVGAIASTSPRGALARVTLDFMCSPAAAALKRRHGMAEPRETTAS